MSKKHETQEIVTQKQTLIETTCDKCGKPLPKPYHWWSNVHDVTIKFEGGSDYGQDGRYVSGWEVEDLCGECVEYLRQLLVDNGFTVKTIDEPDLWTCRWCGEEQGWDRFHLCPAKRIILTLTPGESEWWEEHEKKAEPKKNRREEE